MTTDPARAPESTAQDDPADLPALAPFWPTMVVLTLTGILVVGQTYTLLPVLAEVGSSLGAPASAMTWMVTAFGLAYAVGFLFVGPLTDRYGSRRVAAVGLAVTVVTTAAVALASTLTVGIVLRIFQGLTAAAFAPAAFAYVAEHLLPARRALALTCITSGFLAAAVVMQVAGQAVGSAFGWQWLFLASAPCMLLAAAACWVILRPSVRDRSAPVTARAAFAAMPRLLIKPRLLCLYAATVTGLGAFVAIYTAISLAGPAGLAGDPQALLALRASALPAVIAIPIITPLLSRVAASVRSAAGLGVAAVGAAGAVMFSGSIVGLGVVLLFLVAGVAFAAPALVEDIGSSADQARGTAVALYAFATFLGVSVGPQLVQGLAGWGFTGIAIVVAAVLGGGAILALLAARLGRPPG